MKQIIKTSLKWLLFIIPFLALWNPGSFFFPFITAKNFAFRIIVEFALALYVMVAVVEPSYRPRRSLLFVLFSVFAGIICIADIFAFDTSKALWSNFERMEGFVAVLHLWIYFTLLTFVFRTKEDWIKFILVSLVPYVFVVYFSFLQLAGDAKINQGGVRVDATLGNAAYLAVYLVFYLFYIAYIFVFQKLKLRGIAEAISAGSVLFLVRGLYLLGTSKTPWHTSSYILLAFSVIATLVFLGARFADVKEKKQKTIALLGYVLLGLPGLVILYFTATRGAILGLLLGVFVGASVLAIKDKNKHIKRGSIGLVSLVVLLVLGFYAVRNTSFVTGSPVLSRFASISLNDQSQARQYVWPIAFEGFKEHPILGWGQDNFIYVFGKYYVTPLINHEPWFDRAHNAFIDWLVAGGSLGFLSYLSLFVGALYLLWTKDTFNSREKAVFIGLIVAYSFQNLFIFDNLLSYLLFVSVLAFVSTVTSSPVKDTKTHEDVTTGLAFVVLGVWCVCAWFINYKPLMQNLTLIDAMRSVAGGDTASASYDLFAKSLSYNSSGTFEARQQLLFSTQGIIARSDVTVADKTKFAELVYNEMQQQIKDTPKDSRPYLELAEFLANVGSYDTAILLLNQAKTLTPQKPDIDFALAEAYYNKGNKEGDGSLKKQALDILKSVYERGENFDKLKVPYAVLLVQNKSTINEAIKIFDTVNDLGQLSTVSIIKSLVEGGRADYAESILKREIARNNQDANAYILLSNVYVFEGKKKDAISALEMLKVAVPELASKVDQDIKTLSQ